MYKTLIISALTAAFAMAAPVVHADESLSGRTAAHLTVSVRDVDFQNPSEAKTVYSRLVAAAHDVCDSQSDDVMVQAADSRCERKALKAALSDLNEPALYQVATQARGQAPKQFAFNDARP